MKKLTLPFYENPLLEKCGRGVQCTQVAMKIVLEHFLSKKYTLKQLDKLTGRTGCQATNTFQEVVVLYDLGLRVRYYSKEPVHYYLERKKMENRVRERFGNDGLKIYNDPKRINIPAIIKSAKKAVKYNIFENRKLTFSEVEQYINDNYVPIMAINPTIIYEGFRESIEGHSVVVTGFGENYVSFHESGNRHAQKDKKVDKKTFIDAWNVDATDNDIIVIYGKRKISLIDRLKNSIRLLI